MHLAGPQRLRVLVLDEEVPWPPNTGKRIRTWNLLRRLSSRHDLHLLTYGPATEEARGKLAEHGFTGTILQPLAPSQGPQFWARLMASTVSQYPYSVIKHFTARMQDKVTQLCSSEKFDLVHIEWLPYARYESPGVPRFIVAHNVESDIWRRRAEHHGGLIGRCFFGLQAKRMRVFEQRAAAQDTHIAAVSDLDAETFRSYGAQNVTVVPNGVDLDYFRPRPEVSQSDSLLFVGSLDWYANEDAVREFALHVFPLLRSRNPRITFQVVGRRPSDRLIAMLKNVNGVEMVGEVSDVRPYMAQARAVVVPLRIGGGSRIKILEALAMAKPVISTAIGAEGLSLTNGRDCLIANRPQEFAARVDSLFADPDQQMRLGQNGRALVEQLYGWDAAAERLELAWADAAGYPEVCSSSRTHTTVGAR